jgi:Protein of unknown function (DUF2934)
MISILFIGAGTTLAVFAIWAKTFAGKPKRVEKREKAEIIKQLLALSDRENSVSANSSSPSKKLRLASTPDTRSDALQKATFRKHKPEQRYHRSPTPPAPLRPNQADAEIEDEVRQRAYELYQERGGVEGNPTEDWLQAKKEVLSHKAKAGTT